MPDTIVFVKFVGYASRGIEFLFYSLFLLIPLVFAGNTSELFEFSKMWLTFGIAISIGFLWFSKMILLKKVIFKRTLFDIPILLILFSHLVSTLVSMDPHISLWGYYSRWNGGLLSMITYAFFFWAFVSNFNHDPEENPTTNHLSRKSFFDIKPDALRVISNSLLVSLISGLIVVLWAIPSHFGYDPTCYVFRGTLDTTCWTADFQPTVRIFGPLGQPAWLAAYLGILLPIAGAFALRELRKTKAKINPKFLGYSGLFILFYIALLYSGSRGGIIGVFVSLLFMLISYIYFNRHDLSFLKNKFIPILIGALILVTPFAGIDLPNGTKITYDVLLRQFKKDAPAVDTNVPVTQEDGKAVTNSVEENPNPAIPLGGSSSAEIRSIVWKGGIAAWKANPIFGTGVETYAFAYYKHRPEEHNRVSEWNFLYNKAHNEYINYLVTTGAFGFLSYAAFIILFFAAAVLSLFNKKVKTIPYVGNFSASTKWDNKDPMLLALVASIISMLIVNFFGFSVVITNIYLFLIPAFILFLINLAPNIKEPPLPKIPYVSYAQWGGILGLGALGVFLIFMLIRFWVADTRYALGFNYNQAGDFQTAYPLLQSAIKTRKEPVFFNEVAINDANLAATLATQAGSESAQVIQQLATESLATSEKLVKDHPNNVVFWKTRVRVLYTLARLDPTFYPQALAAIQQTALLAPTDASILYNLGVLYGQNGDSKKAVEVLEQTVKYRPQYSEAHFALGLFYHDLGVDQNGAVKDETYRQKAIAEMDYILKNINPNDPQAKAYFDEWQK
ncbi:MAG: O-antigen ligase family protein [Candidatus Levybacteria bacterium]|nr:O-antigen ligase family protein [Candidatus Levybacteria bacterium]